MMLDTRIRLALRPFLALSLLWGLGAAAQPVPSFELERLWLNPAARGGLLVGGADLLDAQQLRVSLLGHYQHDPLVFVDGQGQRVSTVVGSRVTGHLVAGYGITRWLEVGLQVPLVLWQGGASNLEALGLTPVPATVLGTPLLQARVGFLSQARGAPIDLGLTAMLGIPVGSAAGLTRDETATLVARLGVGRAVGDWVRLSAELGGWVRPSSPLSVTADSKLGSQVDLVMGATTLGDGLRGEVSVRAGLSVTGQPASTELMAGVRLPLGPIELQALGGPGFGQAPGTPLFRVLLGASWLWPTRRCVEGQPYRLAECPELDVDGDGVPNAGDTCPTEKGRAETAGCPDRDADGLTDDVDQCPAVPGPTGRQGCPPRDTDADGLADEVDQCPAERGPAERQGCPVRDSDGDGLLDPDDQCPTQPGDSRARGCPPADQDHDGVEDSADNCRLAPGPLENQGCPPARKQLVVIRPEKLDIKERVFFDTARATIQARSFGLLDQVAAVLIEHPEQELIRVEGHTDGRGVAAVNRKLSQLRAESVRAYLVKKGVAAARLEARGFGADRPVADDKTATGRELNRRVEFVIVRVAAPKPESTEVAP